MWQKYIQASAMFAFQKLKIQVCEVHTLSLNGVERSATKHPGSSYWVSDFLKAGQSQ